MQGYWKSDSLVFVGSKARAYGWKLRSTITKLPIPIRLPWYLNFTITKVDVMDKTNAFVLGGCTSPRQRRCWGYFTLWFKKIDGVWLLFVIILREG